MNIKNYRIIYFLIILFFIAWILYMMFQPYINAILLAAILAGAFSPLKGRLVKWLNVSQIVSVCMVTLFLMIILIVPSIYVTIALTKEIGDFVNSLRKFEIQRTINSLLDNTGNIYLPQIITERFNFSGEQINFVADSLKNATSEIGTYILNHANSLLSNTLSFMVNFFIFTVSVYVFLKNGRLIKSYVVFFMPLSKKNSLLLIKKIEKLNYLTIIGNGIGGIIQGSLAGFVFLFSGAENNILWGVIMTVLAFIPLIGISIIYIPYTAILIAQEDYTTAAFVFICCTMISFVVENVYKTKFISNRMSFNSVLLLFGIIGGLSLFGIAGIFYGPLIILIFQFLLLVTRQTIKVGIETAFSDKKSLQNKNNEALNPTK